MINNASEQADERTNELSFLCILLLIDEQLNWQQGGVRPVYPWKVEKRWGENKQVRSPPSGSSGQVLCECKWVGAKWMRSDELEKEREREVSQCLFLSLLLLVVFFFSSAHFAQLSYSWQRKRSKNRKRKRSRKEQTCIPWPQKENSKIEIEYKWNFLFELDWRRRRQLQIDARLVSALYPSYLPLISLWSNWLLALHWH